MIVFAECSVIGKDLVVDAFVDVFDYLKDVEIGSVIVDTDDTFLSSGPSDEPVYSISFDTVYGSSSGLEEKDDKPQHDSCCSWTEVDGSEDEDEEEDDNETTDDDTDGEDDVDSEDGDDESEKEEELREERKNKHIRIRISASDMGLSTLDDNLFFVYVQAVGIPDTSTPCDKDKEYTVGVAMNAKKMMMQGMNHIREVGNCETPSGFIDWFLRLKAIELSIATGNYEAAIAYWKSFFLGSSISISTTTEDCGCNG